MPDFLLHVPGLAPFRLSRANALLSIGRTPNQDIVLEDPGISRNHGRVLWKDGAAFFEDLGSRHGSFINGEQVRSPRRIRPADTLRMANIDVTIEEVAPEEAPAEPVAGEEETQALPIGDIQGWGEQATGSAGFPGGRAALGLFHDFSLLLLQEPTTERLLEDMLTRLFSFLDAGYGTVWLPDGNGRFSLLSSCSKAESEQPTLQMTPDTVSGAAQRREVMLVRQPAAESPREFGLVNERNTSSAMVVPLEHAGEVLGLFCFDTCHTRAPFSEDELRVVASLGHLAAARVIQQRLSEELQQKQDLEREMRAVEDATQAKSEFLAHMSHEMRTPMNAILGFLHLAQAEALPSEVSGYLQKIESSSQSLLGLLDEVLDLAKIEARKLDLECIPFRVDQVLRQVMDLLGQTAADKGLSLRLAEDATVPPVLLGDALRLRQVLLNLVANAIKFTSEGHVLIRTEHLETAHGAAQVRFTVEDTGIGLTEAQAATLFAPFTQAEVSTSRRFGGTGLGLAIARQLVECMGGTIWVESSPGHGSLFTFTTTFPMAPEQSQVEVAPAPVSDWRTHLAERRILVVDDNALNRELTALLLKTVGAQVDLASQGTVAVEMARLERYDAILMDLEMPDMDGLAATIRIRADGASRACPIIALTAHALTSHRDKCLAGGMTDCLTKPLHPPRLYEALVRWISGAEPQPLQLRPPSNTSTPVGLEALVDLVDVPLLLGRLDGDSDLLVKFLRDFARDPVDGESIRQSMALGQRERALSQVHDLKGIADTLALREVALAARQLEAALRQEDPNSWEACCTSLQETLDRLRKQLAALP